ncbi:MAG: FitA-like ribbon-helix-helix domain-containing protein [Calditrichia bacterium]
MASITVGKLPEEIKEKLRILAAKNGMSLEAFLCDVFKRLPIQLHLQTS